MITKFIGRAGEDAAALYLKKHHYKILAQNYRCRYGEIDIVAKDRKTLVFVEVKFRKNADFMRPVNAVTLSKQKKIAVTALHYISDNDLGDCDCRFDVVEIIGDDINHIINAFSDPLK